MLLGQVDLKPGDIVLTNSGSLAARWINAFGALMTGDSRRSHAALAIGRVVNPPSLIEATWRGVRRTSLDSLAGLDVTVWRNVHLDDSQRLDLVIWAASRIGTPYPFWKLPLFALDAIATSISAPLGLGRVYFFTRALGVSHFVACSQVIGWAWWKATGNPKCFGAHWKSLTPDMIDDWCAEHPSDWVAVAGR